MLFSYPLGHQNANRGAPPFAGQIAGVRAFRYQQLGDPAPQLGGWLQSITGTCGADGCSEGQAAVDILNQLYWQNTAAVLEGGCDAACAARVASLQAKWGPTIDALVAEADNANTWGARNLTLVNRGCCLVRSIGERAQALIPQLSGDLGIVAPIVPGGGGIVKPPDEGPLESLFTAVKILLLGGAVIGLGYGAYRVGSKIYAERKAA